jgi:predicted Fe-Mo cluster-binding NifX family protein
LKIHFATVIRNKIRRIAMRVCFPVAEAKGLDSEVYGHFGSAPAFVVVETETGQASDITNNDQHHEHGMCSPLKALGGHEVDCVVVGGIGAGALMKLGMSGISAYRAGAGTVAENLKLLSEDKLAKFQASHACSGHGHGGGCSH